MKSRLLNLALLVAGCGTFGLQAASICPTTASTTTNCDYIITISPSGSVSVMDVPGSTAFNAPITFIDGTMDPGDDGSLVGVVNDSTMDLTSLTLEGTNGTSGIFDFSYNGICVYTMASYCATAASGHEGPTTTFTDLRSTVLFETNPGTVDFGPGLAPGQSTYFSLEDAASGIDADGGRWSVRRWRPRRRNRERWAWPGYAFCWRV